MKAFYSLMAATFFLFTVFVNVDNAEAGFKDALKKTAASVALELISDSNVTVQNVEAQGKQEYSQEGEDGKNRMAANMYRGGGSGSVIWQGFHATDSVKMDQKGSKNLQALNMADVDSGVGGIWQTVTLDSDLEMSQAGSDNVQALNYLSAKGLVMSYQGANLNSATIKQSGSGNIQAINYAEINK